MSRRGPALDLELARRVRGWMPPRRELTRWVSAALGRRRAGALALAVVGPGESRRLNARYRGQDRPTNVLSFPAPPALRGARALGDLIICPRVLEREARAQAKPRRAHWAHLVVHGTLHLLGYDHVRGADARRMERREVRVLRTLGFADPYQAPDGP